MIDPFDVLDATWPPARKVPFGDVVLREGKGGGKRVSATSARCDISASDLKALEDQMTALGQNKLFSVRGDQPELDTVLAENGYLIIDQTVILYSEISALTSQPVPPVTCFPIWEPLQIMKDIWKQGGIGPARLNVMERATGPKTAILGRINEKPGGTGFVAIDGTAAMIHALEILPHQRRYGLATHMMRAAAFWAADHGAQDMLLAVTRANTKALALYSGLGMREIAGYHYRIKS